MLTLFPIRQPDANRDQTTCAITSIMPLYVSQTLRVLLCYIKYVKTIKQLHIVVRTLSSKQKFSTGVKITISMVNIVQTALSSAFTVMLYNQRRNFTGYTVREIKNSLFYCFKNMLFKKFNMETIIFSQTL